MNLAADLIEETGTDPAGRDGLAVFRTGRHYRYRLLRTWGAEDWPRRMAVVGCNPSTAGADVNDQTVRRLCHFAAREGCSELEVVNLFALVATDPADLLSVDDPVGGQVNDMMVNAAMLISDVVVLAWGNMPADLGLGWRADEVAARVDSMHLGACRRVVCFGRTAAGQPRHPARLANDAALANWTWAP